MNQRDIFFNFQGFRVKVSSSFEDVLIKLEKDFYLFRTQEGSGFDLYLEIRKEKISEEIEISWDRVTSKVRYYQNGAQRFCYYDDKVRSEINFDTEEAKVIGIDENLVHEISYLLILTRVGKKLDLKRFHRIHAFGLTVNNTLLLGLLPSGAGKTTFLSQFIADDLGGIVSDDSPLIDSQGDVHPFLIRIGFEENGKVPRKWSDKPFYFLERRHFGLKKLLSFEDISFRPGGNYERVFLLRVSKKRGERVRVKEEFGLLHLKHLFKEGVIGIGLPMLYEYFWETGWKDFLIKTSIFFGRLGAFLRLWLKAKKYKVVLTNNPEQNGILLVKELERF